MDAFMLHMHNAHFMYDTAVVDTLTKWLIKCNFIQCFFRNCYRCFVSICDNFYCVILVPDVHFFRANSLQIRHFDSIGSEIGEMCNSRVKTNEKENKWFLQTELKHFVVLFRTITKDAGDWIAGNMQIKFLCLINEKPKKGFFLFEQTKRHCRIL